MKKLFLSISVIVLVFNLRAQNSQLTDPVNIKLIWKTDTVFQIPESVIWDETRNLIYVSNVSGTPSAKDHNGFISKLSEDGKIIEIQWIKGLNAPKGMAVFGSKLYVSDIDHLAEIDINTSKIIKLYDAPDAVFLNDVVVDQTGTVYISDTQKSTIYILVNGKIEKWIESDELKGVNGLFLENEYLLAGTRNDILKISVREKKMSHYLLNTSGIDGLGQFKENTYIYSDWTGNIYLHESGKEKRLILSTADQEINAADIFYQASKKILLVPTFHDNRVMAYQVELIK